jgi:hypothetical protein
MSLNRGDFLCGVVGPFTWELQSDRLAEPHWKGGPQRVTAPYAKDESPPEGYLSRSGHVKPRLNRRGPSRKAKYSLTTDSKRVGRPKDEKNPC